MAAAADATAPRWTEVPAGRGHYESYYLRAVSPTEPRGIWIRYTVSVLPGGQATGQLWCTYFDRDRPRPRAVRIDAGAPASGDGAWIRLGDSSFGPAEVTGSARSGDLAASWSLRHRSDEQPLWHLGRDWMYTARLPRTKLLLPQAVRGLRRQAGDRRRDDRRRGLARDGRPQLGRTACRAVDLAVGARLRGRGVRHLARRGRRPDPDRAGDHAVGRERRGEPGRRTPRARRAGPARGGDRGRGGVRAAAARLRRHGHRVGLRARRRVRRLGLRRPRRIRAPRAELLGRRSRRRVVDRQGPAARRAHRSRPGRLRVGPALDPTAQAMSASLVRRWSTALVCSWQIRLSVTPRTRPMSARVSPSK